uniref:DUF5659 domain-containing protein n=1 Tax=Strongyloides venezuelensis TaxID=75913 RepID=A0A0K0FGH4_STRVS
MGKYDYGRGCEYEITSPELKKFLNNMLIKSEALKYINNTGKFCKYLNHGIHLVTARTLDKNGKNANVVFYSMEGIEIFFKMEHIQSQEEALMELKILIFLI